MPREIRTDPVHAKTGTVSRTHQNFLEEANINTVMGKYRRVGFFENVNVRVPAYADFSTVGEFQDAQNKLVAAREYFESLPARLRNRCDNDPAKLIEFVEDPANIQEMIDLGIIDKPEPQATEEDASASVTAGSAVENPASSGGSPPTPSTTGSGPDGGGSGDSS